jgi:hypothetical protein
MDTDPYLRRAERAPPSSWRIASFRIVRVAVEVNGRSCGPHGGLAPPWRCAPPLRARSGRGMWLTSALTTPASRSSPRTRAIVARTACPRPDEEMVMGPSPPRTSPARRLAGGYAVPLGSTTVSEAPRSQPRPRDLTATAGALHASGSAAARRSPSRTWELTTGVCARQRAAAMGVPRARQLARSALDGRTDLARSA